MQRSWQKRMLLTNLFNQNWCCQHLCIKGCNRGCFESFADRDGKMATADQFANCYHRSESSHRWQATGRQDLQDLSTRLMESTPARNTLTSDVASLKSAQDDLTEAIKAANDKTLRLSRMLLAPLKMPLRLPMQPTRLLKNYVTTSDYNSKD